ncbi:hypothetical protein VOI54_06420 [Tamlana sp. 2201CG12-4]|uniref:hypothetical protein n=1 Tax=Tamlana sp. 2201CG12-4 TaxID=3112582 RepID=UPI002DBD1588|nr:hypothetical protein [Tamlana sp. 2201CG12-4]MEC3906646.1 hypothetical protein [Tamlana sp. 2201CG12-4]
MVGESRIKLFKKEIFHGFLQVIFSAYWFYHYGILYYYYDYTDLFFYFMYPTWMLIIYLLLSFWGICIGLQVIFGKRTVRSGYFRILALFVIGLVLENIFHPLISS